MEDIYEQGWNYYRAGHDKIELFSFLKSFGLDDLSAVELLLDIIYEADDDYDI